MEYEEYEKKCEEIKKLNDRYLELFEAQLKEKGLSSKTINNHLSNLDFFLNNYNFHEGADTMQEGCTKMNDFFGYYFIRKCMWSTPASIKQTAASFKKFYKCMLEYGEIEVEDYEKLIDTIAGNLTTWQDECAIYNDDSSSIFF